MKQSSPLLFFGNERLSTGFEPTGAPTLEALLRKGYNVVAVVANYEAGTSRLSRKLEIAAVAEQYNIPLLLPRNLSDIKEQLIALKPEIGILVAYGKIIPQSIIDIFPKGILNIHPSLLPLYRGSTPIEQVILDGATQTGVSIMRIVKAMDAGPIYKQATIPLSGAETKKELTQQLLTLGGQLLLEVLPRVLHNTIEPWPQDETKATFCSLIQKIDSELDWQKPAAQLERQIRAYTMWPKSRAHLEGQQVIITQVRVAKDKDDGSLVKKCNPGWLEIQELIAPSGRRMSGADFLRGYKK